MRIDLKKILCPVDFSPTSDHAVRYAATLAEDFGAELILLHVFAVPALAINQYYGLPYLEPGLVTVAPPYIRTSAGDEQRELPLDGPEEDQDTDVSVEPIYEQDASQVYRPEDLAADLRRDHACTATALVKEGKAFVEIIKTARDEAVDLIVMGSHGRTGLAHMLIGSTTEKVVRMAPCPVLTVKHPEHEFVMP